MVRCPRCTARRCYSSRGARRPSLASSSARARAPDDVRARRDQLRRCSGGRSTREARRTKERCSASALPSRSTSGPGEYWRVATCMFLHIGLVHILMNSYMAIGWATCPRAHRSASARFLTIYLLSGRGRRMRERGQRHPLRRRASPPGASGALFGVLGATLRDSPSRLPELGGLLGESWRALGRDPGRRSGRRSASRCSISTTRRTLGGLVVGSVGAWLFTSTVAAPRSRGWMALARRRIAALFVVAARPWWSPTGDSAQRHCRLRGQLSHGQEPAPGRRDAVPHRRRARHSLRDEGVLRTAWSMACEVLADYTRGAVEATPECPRRRPRRQARPAARRFAPPSRAFRRRSR